MTYSLVTTVPDPRAADGMDPGLADRGAVIGAVTDELAAMIAREQERGARKVVQAKARAQRAAARAAARAIPPETLAAFAHLALTDLRSARQLIAEEEERLGYWQRILAARLDAVSGVGIDPDMERLRPALSAARLQSARSAISRICASPLPALPNLDLMWVAKEHDACSRQLDQVATELTRYRDALAALLKAITHELIARYRLEPTACLAVLRV